MWPNSFNCCFFFGRRINFFLSGVNCYWKTKYDSTSSIHTWNNLIHDCSFYLKKNIITWNNSNKYWYTTCNDELKLNIQKWSCYLRKDWLHWWLFVYFIISQKTKRIVAGLCSCSRNFPWFSPEAETPEQYRKLICLYPFQTKQGWWSVKQTAINNKSDQCIPLN